MTPAAPEGMGALSVFEKIAAMPPMERLTYFSVLFLTMYTLFITYPLVFP